MAKILTEHLTYLLEEMDTNCAYHYMNHVIKRTLSVLCFEGDAFKYISYENGKLQERIVTNATNIQKIIGSIYDYVIFSIDTMLNASGNGSGYLESLLANAAEFFTCRINNQMQLVWSPDKKHNIEEIGVWDDYDSLRDATAKKKCCIGHHY